MQVFLKEAGDLKTHLLQSLLFLPSLFIDGGMSAKSLVTTDTVVL